MPENESSSAVLRAAVTTALGAIPLEGALVTVSTAADENGARTLLYAVPTDAGGLTPPLPLPTPPRGNSLTPDSGPPFAVYTVEASRAGYTPRAALYVTMFADVPALLPIALTPLPENAASDAPALTADTAPQALAPGEED